MPPVDSEVKVRSGINVTPLVDVVLVLLIIFMIIAPHLQSETDVDLPTTDRPPDRPDDGRQIVVLIDAAGLIRIDEEPVTLEQFPQRLREVADGRADWPVVIKGDADLPFGAVRQAMFAIESAGFADVGLIAERREAAAREG
jgi:biopolymer transport protein ExbD